MSSALSRSTLALTKEAIGAVFITYHPAYLLRNQALSEKRRVWEDMLAAMEKLGAPINEKQRNYFRG